MERRNAVASRINELVAIGAARSSEQNAEFDRATADFDRLSAELSRLGAADRINSELAQPQPRAVRATSSTFTPGAYEGVTTSTVAAAKLDAFIAALPYGAHRIAATAGDVFQESQGGDGGYLLPVDKRSLLSILAPPELVHSRCDILYSSSNSTQVPIDEDADWSSSLAAEDVNEGAALTEQKAAFKLLDLTLAKKGVLTRVTREMLEDNTGIGERVTTKLGGKLAWKLHKMAITAFLASGGKITVAKTSGAAAGSAPDIDNILAMETGLLAENYAKSVWLANPKIKPALSKLVLGQVPVFMQGQSLANGAPETLRGRPIFFVDGLPAQGTEGDLTLVDPSMFYGVLKSTGPRIEESVHAEFKNDVVQYRGYVRAAFASKLSAKITRPDSTEAGNVVTLGTRA
jgi:HK97 family phage major capsid protein